MKKYTITTDKKLFIEGEDGTMIPFAPENEETEKVSFITKVKNTGKKAGDFAKKHWKGILLGTVAVVGGALAAEALHKDDEKETDIYLLDSGDGEYIALDEAEYAVASTSDYSEAE